ncbi:MAG: DNA/RNA nuclease SfsA [Alphaproteobacteria bacterium]
MRFPAPLIRGTLVRRYKRFLSDIELANGEIIVAHCANPGSMLGLQEPGSEVWLSQNTNPKAKLGWRWELVRADGGLVCINTGRPNGVAAAAITAGQIPDLSGYAALRREVRYGNNSRIDILLEDGLRPDCYVEIKCVTLRRPLGADPTAAEFPDSVTKRGAKHLAELIDTIAAGRRAVMLYIVFRHDCDHFRVAADIDPAYANALEAAMAQGVEAICYDCRVSVDGIELASPLPVVTRQRGAIAPQEI